MSNETVCALWIRIGKTVFAFCLVSQDSWFVKTTFFGTVPQDLLHVPGRVELALSVQREACWEDHFDFCNGH